MRLLLTAFWQISCQREVRKNGFIGFIKEKALMPLRACFYRMLIALGTITLFGCGAHRIPKLQYYEPTGREIYMTYCARCHGDDGKGRPAEVAGRPDGRADLTELSKRNGGKFPAQRVEAILGGAEDIPAHHGPDPMPISGDLFWARRSLTQETAKAQVDRLIDYLESVQQR